MASVHYRLFKTFRVHLNRVFRDRCGICKYRTFKPYDPLPMEPSKFVSRLYQYYWEPNHHWNGGHLSQLYFRIVYKPAERVCLVLYYFNDEHYGTRSWFNREVPFNYVKWCIKKDPNELLRIVFPFFKGKRLPERMETPFDAHCDKFAKELANSEAASNEHKTHTTYSEWKLAQRKAVLKVIKVVKARQGDKPSAAEFDARVELLKSFNTLHYLVTHPNSKQIYEEMAIKIRQAQDRCEYKANLMLDRW